MTCVDPGIESHIARVSVGEVTPRVLHVMRLFFCFHDVCGVAADSGVFAEVITNDVDGRWG